jgi:homospermidine synthase
MTKTKNSELQTKAKNREPQTKAKRKYNNANYDIITIFVKKGYKEIVKDHAASKNMSMNEYVKRTIYAKLRDEGEPGIDELD